MVFVRSLVVLLVLAATSAWGQTPQRSERTGAMSAVTQDQRFALAIGINDYRDLGRLTKAVNDARAMGQALERVGFRVTVLTNASRADMNRAINQFVLNLSGGGQGVFFFAGHGVQINNQNYLLPADIHSPQVEADVADQAVSLQGIQDKLAEVRAKFALLVVDACRDNPLPRRAGRSLGATRGLAQASSAEGQMVVFSAGANQQALDRLSDRDTDPNGVFTREFLPWIGKPGVSIRDVVLQVRTSVRARARSVNHDQFPAVYDQVDGNFFFVARISSPDGTSPQPPTPQRSTVTPVDPVEAAYWAEVSRLDDLSAYRAYMATYPHGAYIAEAQKAFERVKQIHEAQAQLAEDQAWKRAEQLSSFGSYAGYLARHPNGRYAPLASLRLERLRPWRDCAECPEMVGIPSGSFMMGSPLGEEGRRDSEGPQRQVWVNGFALGKAEITRDQYRIFIEETGYHSRGGGCHWDSPGYRQEGTHPVVCVSWDDAKAYVLWLSNKTGETYRLPSESEWEYAARGGTTTPWPWGLETPEACRHANIDDSSHRCNDGYGKTAPVGSFTPNGFGINDMIGNVWEWVEDCYQDSYAGAPSDGSAQVGGPCRLRVIRGGSWVDGPSFVRTANRTAGAASERHAAYGFRVVRRLKTP
jgi:formylglycine-generating enzyme required for sulfatase activity